MHLAMHICTGMSVVVHSVRKSEHHAHAELHQGGSQHLRGTSACDRQEIQHTMVSNIEESHFGASCVEQVPHALPVRARTGRRDQRAYIDSGDFSERATTPANMTSAVSK